MIFIVFLSLAILLSSNINAQDFSDHESFDWPSHAEPVVHKSKYYNGNDRNRFVGGSCRDFFANNTINSCCSKRDDDCFMIHFSTRCYCDVFCDRYTLDGMFANPYDCCPDGYRICSATALPPTPTADSTTPEPPTTTSEPQVISIPDTSIPLDTFTLSPIASPDITTPSEDSLYCKKNGIFYQNGQVYFENCKKCICQAGVLRCYSSLCLVNETLIKDVNNQNYGWLASNYTQFWTLTLEQGYQQHLGAKLSSSNLKSTKTFFANQTNAFYDFRDEPFIKRSAPNVIRDQGKCAAAWAFSTVDVLADRAAKQNKKSVHAYPSVEMLISCLKTTSSNKCEPVEIDTAWAYIESFLPNSQGLVDETCYPLESAFVGVSGRCRIFEPDPSSCTDNQVFDRPYFKSTRAYQVRAHTPDIMHEIAKNGPVQMVFKVYSDFFTYKSGIYSPSPDALVLNSTISPYHAVKVLGWGSENGLDYWIAANSWGSDWGENGYFRIKREEPLTEIGKHVFAAWGFYDR